jgi:hypothetical protein
MEIMMVTIRHAPYAVLGDLVIAYGRTTKSACGKRIQTDRLISRDETTCPDCLRAIARDRTEAIAMRALAEDILRAHGCPHCGAPFEDVAAWNDHRIRQHR